MRTIAALVFLIVGCGHQARSTLPTRTTSLLDALPNTAQGYGYVNIEALRASTHAATLAPAFAKVAELEATLHASTGTDARVAEAAMALVDFRTLDHSQGGFVLAVRLDRDVTIRDPRMSVSEGTEVQITRCDDNVYLFAASEIEASCVQSGPPNWALSELRRAIAEDHAVGALTFDIGVGIRTIEIPMLRAALSDLEGAATSVALDGDGMIVRYSIHVHDPRAAATLDYIRVVLARVMRESDDIPASLGFLFELEGRYEDDFVEWSTRLDAERIRTIVATDFASPATVTDPALGANEDFHYVPPMAGTTPLPVVVFLDDDGDEGLTAAQAQTIAELSGAAVLRIGPPQGGWSADSDASLEHVRVRREMGVTRAGFIADADRVVLVGSGHAGWVACELAARQPGLAAGAVCISPNPFTMPLTVPAFERLGTRRYWVIDFQQDPMGTAWVTALRQANGTVEHQLLEGVPRPVGREEALADLIGRAVIAFLTP